MKRIGFVLLWIALLITMSVSAQTFGLSGADAILLATANSTPLDSFAVDYTLRFDFGLDTLSLKGDLSGSGAADRAASSLDMSMKGTLQAGSTQMIPLNDELRLVNDSLYLNPGDGWQVHGGASAYLVSLINLYGTLNADSAALGKLDLSGIDGINDIRTALMTDPSTFLSAKRLAVETVGDVQTAHFQLGIDLHGLMQTDAFVNAVAALAVAQGTSYQIYDHAKLAGMIRDFSAMFVGASLNVEQFVGLSDSLIHRMTLTLNMPIDPSKGGYSDAPFTATATLDLTLSGLNQPQSIAAPADAAPVTDFTFPAPPALAAPGTGVTQYVFLDWVGDHGNDRRSFDALAGDKVTITVRKLDMDFDPHVALLSPSGDVLTENEDHDQPGFLVRDYDAQIVDFPLPAEGTYSVQIGEYDGVAGSVLVTVKLQR